MQSESSEVNEEERILNLPELTTKSGEVIHLKPGLQDSEGEIAQSINSVNVCGNHLLDMMAKLKKEDASEVMTACEVAKQVVSLARAKIDLIKALK